MSKPGHINSPLDSAVWAELNNCSGMQRLVINFYSITDFYFKFCQVDRRISNQIENYYELPPSADFLPDRKCYGKQSNKILKAFLEPLAPCMQRSSLISFIFAYSKDWRKLSTLKHCFPKVINQLRLWQALQNWSPICFYYAKYYWLQR